METSLKIGFAQVFSCCPKNLSCPNFGGGCSPPRPPDPYAYAADWPQLDIGLASKQVDDWLIQKVG